MLRGEGPPNVIMGQLLLPTQGATGGILFGGDVLLYRSEANYLALGVGDNLFIQDNELIRFRDSNIYMRSFTDGHFDLYADISIDLNTPLVEIEGNLTVGLYLYHHGDLDTFVKFDSDYVGIFANGNAFFETDATGIGFFGVAEQAQQAHIIDADGTIGDITAKFNTLLADLEGYGLLST